MIFQYYKQEKEDEGNYYSLAYTLLNTNFFLLLFCYFSIFFCYVMELHLRQRYRDSGTIFRWMSTSNNNNNQRRQQNLRVTLFTGLEKKIVGKTDGFSTQRAKSCLRTTGEQCQPMWVGGGSLEFSKKTFLKSLYRSPMLLLII